MKRIVAAALTVVLALASASPALACAACFGKTDSPLAHGMNAGIFTLLAVIGTMLAMIASFFVFITRRAGRLPASSSDSESTTAS